MKTSFVAALGAIAFFVGTGSGCSGPPPVVTDGGVDAGAPLDSGTPDAGSTDAGIDAGSANACGDGGAGFYVVDEASHLLKFDPIAPSAATAFTDAGLLSCAPMDAPLGSAGLATPYSLAVAGDGRVLILYNSGELFVLDPSTMGCVKTAFSASQEWKLFDLAFAPSTESGGDEVLYIAGGDTDVRAGGSFGTLSPSSWQATTLGPLPVLGETEALIAGTSSGQLFGLFPSSQSDSTVQQLDRQSGAVIGNAIQVPKPQNGSPSAWAFAAANGKLFVFVTVLDDIGTSTSFVRRLDQASGADEGVVLTMTPVVVAAGASSCMP